MGFRSKCNILDGQVIYVKKSKLNIADMWIIPLDHVTYTVIIFSMNVERLRSEVKIDTGLLAKGISKQISE